MPDIGSVYCEYSKGLNKKQLKAYHRDVAEFNKYDTKRIKTTFGLVILSPVTKK
jgi:hypothetical protein